MSLAEKLKAATCPVETIETGGMRFKVKGLSIAAVGKLTAKYRRKDGSLDGNNLDLALLSECVRDADDDSQAQPSEWRDVPRAITGPLMKVVLRLNGLDGDDIDPKGGEPTES